jgi:hypothetical protein
MLRSLLITLVLSDYRSMFGGKKEAPEDDGEPTQIPKIKPVAAMSPAEEAILDLEKTMGEDWYELLKDEFQKGYFKSVSLPQLNRHVLTGQQIRNRLIAESRSGKTIYPTSKHQIASDKIMTDGSSRKYLFLVASHTG